MYATGKTREALGDALASLALKWANDGVSKKPIDVFVVMPHDRFWEVLPDDFRAKIESHRGLVTEIDKKVTHSIIKGMPRTISLQARSSEDRGYCIINLPAITDDRAASYAQIFAYDKGHRMKEVGGSARQWWTMAVAHEAEHCDDPGRPLRLEEQMAYEISADKGGMDNMLRHWGELFPYEPGGSQNFLRDFMGARATALFRSEGNAHATFAGIGMPGKSYTQSQARPPQEEDVMKIRAAIASMEQKILERHDRNLNRYMPAEYRLSRMQDLSNDYAALYGIIRELYVEGAFREDPLQQYMAEGYLEWTARLFNEVVSPNEPKPHQHADEEYQVASPGHEPH
ncbi:MAG: hypothetical protein LRZ85_04415 [Alphaproteobacteria bacterium]|nr:hypothetical protein [Alphaproteobacteria bacterium]